MFVLKRSFGKWSAGTPCDIQNDQELDSEDEVWCEMVSSKPPQGTGRYETIREHVKIPIELLVRRRDRTRFLDTPIRSQRRRGMDEVYSMMQK